MLMVQTEVRIYFINNNNATLLFLVRFVYLFPYFVITFNRNSSIVYIMFQDQVSIHT